MAAVGAISTSLGLSSSSKRTLPLAKPRISFLVKTHKNSEIAVDKDPNLSTFLSRLSPQKISSFHTGFSVKAASSSSVDSSEYTEETATKVRFQSSLNLPGCSTSLSLLGTGYREKVFAIIGEKVYAAGLYVNQSIFTKLDAWKGRSAAELKQVSISSEGMPSTVDATIKSINVTSALFDVFLGGDPVSPTLNSSEADGLAAALK